MFFSLRTVYFIDMVCFGGTKSVFLGEVSFPAPLFLLLVINLVKPQNGSVSPSLSDTSCFSISSIVDATKINVLIRNISFIIYLMTTYLNDSSPRPLPYLST